MPTLNTRSGSRWLRCATHSRFGDALAVIGLSLLFGQTALAQTPLAKQLRALPFKIAYETYTNDNWEIFVMNADGSNPVNLTHTPKEHEHYPQSLGDGRGRTESEAAGGPRALIILEPGQQGHWVSSTGISKVQRH